MRNLNNKLFLKDNELIFNFSLLHNTQQVTIMPFSFTYFQCLLSILILHCKTTRIKLKKTVFSSPVLSKTEKTTLSPEAHHAHKLINLSQVTKCRCYMKKTLFQWCSYIRCPTGTVTEPMLFLTIIIKDLPA